MNKPRTPASILTPVLALVFGMMTVPALGADLSRYRNIHFGADLPTVANATGAAASEAKTIHRRPALIQELEWRPQPLGASRQAESVQTVVFRFCGGELFGIRVNYDRYETEGLTADDVIDAISVGYGIAEKPAASTVTPDRAGDPDEVVARWQDLQYSFELTRSSYSPTFTLVGVQKKLQATALVAITEAKRLDDQEAPQREAARMAGEKEIEQANLDKSRLLNRPKFRP